MSDAKDVVIVTGSSGFIGSAVEKFVGRFRLVGFDREISPHPSRRSCGQDEPDQQQIIDRLREHGSISFA
jgi:nucleoside-diphosphate-sugar epimerase